jgi:hypothetical protein
MQRRTASPLVCRDPHDPRVEYFSGLHRSYRTFLFLDHPILIDNFLHKVLPPSLPDFQRGNLLFEVHFRVLKRDRESMWRVILTSEGSLPQYFVAPRWRESLNQLSHWRQEPVTDLLTVNECDKAPTHLEKVICQAHIGEDSRIIGCKSDRYTMVKHCRYRVGTYRRCQALARQSVGQ